MGFFGEVINEEKTEIPIPDGYILKLLIACLPTKGKSSLYIQTNNEENGFMICNLNSHNIPQYSLQHEFGPEDSPILFWTVGESLHLTGNWIWDSDEDEYDYCDNDENDHINCEDHDHDHDHQDDEENEEKEENGNEEVIEENNHDDKQEEIVQEVVVEEKSKKDRKPKKEKKNQQKQDINEQNNVVTEKTSNKRPRDNQETSTTTISTTTDTSIDITNDPASKKLKNEKKDKTSKKKSEPIIPSSQLVVVSKPPTDKRNARPKWNIKPLNNEGLLIPDPKQKTLSSGILITDHIIGYSNEPKFGTFVSIIYEGLFPDGKVFDHQLDRNNPLTFRKGSGQVIRGLDLGLEGMRIGGSREIVIPPALGYGSTGIGEIPANQTLVFRVTLIGEKKRRG